ncbi:DUF523 domain-containing protein [bacterium]|nr:DUF523 domain-containing protein [bacterium]
MRLICACLLGIRCTWDNRDIRKERAVKLLQNEILIPVCPEQLGGLPTPRPCQEIQKGSGEDVLDKKCPVLNIKGEDVTDYFIKGAQETLKIALLFSVKEFISKSRSPSCGSGKIYNGTFSGKLTQGNGVTVAFLLRNGFTIIREEDL